MRDSTLRYLTTLIQNPSLRQYVFRLLEKRLRNELVQQGIGQRPRRVLEDQFQMVRNILWTLDRAMEQGRLSSQVTPTFLRVLGNVWLKGKRQRREFRKTHGFGPPAFLTISLTKRCNLQCSGCYADSSRECAETLDYDVLTRIVREKTELWGSHFTVLSGGEPMLYQSQGKDIFDLAREHRDNLFLMYTNGTLINEASAEKFADVGNITPAISVEGFERETDVRRGVGTHAKIRSAFKHLRRVGVPYGISLTANRHNAALVLSDALMDYYFEWMGVCYAWIFQYMPIGRGSTLALMPTPEQRVTMWRRERTLINQQGRFLVDFWNCGTVSNGCVSAGTESGGYLYIDWNGNVMPCVFNPYYTHNIVQSYAEGGNLSTVLLTPMMEAIRQWQRRYVLHRPPDKVGNILCQCPIRDHHHVMRRILERHNAQPADEAAAEALQDDTYYREMAAYGQRLNELTTVIWAREYLDSSERGQSDVSG